MGNAHGSLSRNDEGKNVEIFVKSAISHHGRRRDVFIAISLFFAIPPVVPGPLQVVCGGEVHQALHLLLGVAALASPAFF